MLIRFHHVLADGLAAVALLGALFTARLRPQNRRRRRGCRDPCRFERSCSPTISAGASLRFASAWANSSIREVRLTGVGRSFARSHRWFAKAGLRACRSINRSADTID